MDGAAPLLGTLQTIADNSRSRTITAPGDPMTIPSICMAAIGQLRPVKGAT